MKLCSAFLLVGISGSTRILSAAACEAGTVRIEPLNGRLILRNKSARPLVAYALADTAVKSDDGTPARTWSGVFTGGDALKPNASMELATSGELARSGGTANPVLDYLRFADGSSCGAALTVAARNIIARFASEAAR